MSFLLQEPIKQSNNPNRGRMRSSIRTFRNSNSAAGSIVGDDSRIFPGLGSTSFTRGNRKLSRQQTSGNQIMLQRQKSINKPYQQEGQNQHQKEQPTKQEQENLGDYTMDRVMQDLHILEQQQREAKTKLVSAQTTKQKRLDQQRQLNTLLENKNYSNGALRAKLRQSHEFLSVATRDLGNRKLITDRLQDGIATFECKLKRGLQSAKMIRICGAKIDSLLIFIDHKVAYIGRIKMESMQVNAEILQKFERTEKKDRMLRLAIQDSHRRARELGEEKAFLRAEINGLDDDKMVAQNTEQSTELRIQTAHDQTKAEKDRVASSKRTLSHKIGETTKQRETIRSEIKDGSNFLETLKLQTKCQYDKIIKYRMVEGHDATPETKVTSPIFDQSKFREDLARREEEIKSNDDELDLLRKSIEETELETKMSNERTHQNKNGTSAHNTSAKALTDEEEKIRKHVVDFQTSLEYARAEVAKLEQSFQDMKEIRGSELCVYSKSTSDCDNETRQHINIVENLKLKIKSEDTSLRTKIRLFEDNEKHELRRKVQEAKEISLSVEEKYKQLVEISSDRSIESKLKEDFKCKFDDETIRWDDKNKSLISRCSKHLKNFRFLDEINCEFNPQKNKGKQIEIALADLEYRCSTRKANAETTKEQKMLLRKERKVEIEATRAKLKRREEARAKIKRNKVHKESNRRLAILKLKGQNAPRKTSLQHSNENFLSTCTDDNPIIRQRCKKGPNFFDPREDDDEEDGNGKEGNDRKDHDSTPFHPRQLVSSFLSQSSGQRVRWVDDDVGGDCGSNNVCDENYQASQSKVTEQLDSSKRIHKRRTKSNEIVQIDRSVTKYPRTSDIIQKSCTSNNNTDTSKMNKMASESDSRPLVGRRRHRSDAMSSRKRVIKRDRSMPKYLENGDVPFTNESRFDSSSMNTNFSLDGNASHKNAKKEDCNDLDKKHRDRSSTLGTDGISLQESKGLKCDGIERKVISKSCHQSISIVHKEKPCDSSIPPKECSKARKSGIGKSRSTHPKRRDKNRQKSEKEGVSISSLKEINDGGESSRVSLDASKEKAHISQGRALKNVCEDSSSVVDTVVLAGKVEGKKRNHDVGSRRKNKDHCEGRIDHENDNTYKKGKPSRSKNTKKPTDEEFNKERRFPSFDSREKPSSKRAKHGRLASAERNLRGKDYEKSDNDVKKSFTDRSTDKKSRTKDITGISLENSSRLVISKEPGVKVRNKSTSCSSLAQVVSKEKHKKIRENSNPPKRDIKKNIREKTSKEYHRRDSAKANTGVAEKKTSRGESIQVHGSLDRKTSLGNGVPKKRKVKEDNISVSSTKTTLTARRRKKRNTGLSQRSTATNVRDESCDFNFQ